MKRPRGGRQIPAAHHSSFPPHFGGSIVVSLPAPLPPPPSLSPSSGLVSIYVVAFFETLGFFCNFGFFLIPTNLFHTSRDMSALTEGRPIFLPAALRYKVTPATMGAQLHKHAGNGQPDKLLFAPFFRCVLNPSAGRKKREIFSSSSSPCRSP